MRKAAETIQAAKTTMHAAILEAHAEGVRVVEIAEATGYTRQRIYQLLEAAGAGVGEAKDRARLAELDGRWDELVTKAADRLMPLDAQREQLRRNGANAKAKRAQAGVNRAGKPSGAVSRNRRVRPTVRAEVELRASVDLLRYLEQNRGLPLIDRIIAELDEAAVLRQRLEAISDARRGF